jgi:RNA polymerase sigma-70 factor, ECF subfamily
MSSPRCGTNPFETRIRDPRVADGSGSFDAGGGRDPAALAAVYRAHGGYVWRVLRHCGVPDADLDDAVQDTFLVVFRRLPELDGRASLRTWIYAVAVRVASTRRRSQRREAARREHAGRRMHGVGAADPEAELSKAEAAELVDRLLDELDASKRTVFVLAELEGVKVPEISRILGVNPRTVHSRLRLARERFGSALARLQAHEANNRRVARLRPRPLLDRAANDRPPASRRNAVMATLAVRLEHGAAPTLEGWQALALAGRSAGSWLPMAAIGAAGMAAVAVAAAVATTSPFSRPYASADANRHGSPPPPVATGAIASHEPIVRTGSMIHDPSVPNSRPGTATSVAGGPLGQSGTVSVQVDQAIMRTESTTGHGGLDAAHPRATSGARGDPPVPSNAAPSPMRTASAPPRAPRPMSTPAAGLHGTDAGATTDGPTPAASALMPTPIVDANATRAPTLAAETQLLEQARGALHRGDLQAARAMLDRHSAEFPQGLLLDEARSTRLRVLCAGGRAAEATALADRWSPAQTSSRWHDVVAASCR